MPKATYMYWQKRFDRDNPNKELKEKIMKIHLLHKDYGYRRMLGEFHKQGYFVNKKRVQRIMQKLSLQVTSFTRKSRKCSSYKGKVGKVAPNRLRRRFDTKIPHQKITTDTTEFKYYDVDSKGYMIIKKLYLDPFMDLCNSEIISYGMSPTPSAKNILDALNTAIKKNHIRLSISKNLSFRSRLGLPDESVCSHITRISNLSKEVNKRKLL